MAEVTNNSVTSYDYSTIGGFGSEATQSLSGETINKIRAAEEKAVLDPIVKDLENWELESEKITELSTKISTFLETIKQFDLFSSSNNAFEQISASTTGSGAIFDAADVGSLQEGTYVVEVDQLAQKDVWQSNGKSSAVKDAAIVDPGADFVITGAGGATVNITDVDGMTLQEIADTINQSSIATASIEQTGTDEYKLVIKSADPGTDNALTISGSSSLAGEYNANPWDHDGDAGTPDIPLNHVQVAQNLTATIDGIDYNVSSNSITVDGNLKVTATEESSTTTLSISKDDSSIIPAVQTMADAYNEIVGLITAEIYDNESPVENKSGLRDILSGLKNMFFSEYGPNKDDDTKPSNAINFGLEFDKNGLLILDEDALGAALTEDYDEVKDFFLGTAEDKGFGTLMKEYLDEINSYDGLLTNYQTNLLERKETLEEEKEAEIDRLDTKYSTMAAQFVEYASIIAQIEASFGGLKMMIQQSTSGN